MSRPTFYNVSKEEDTKHNFNTAGGRKAHRSHSEKKIEKAYLPAGKTDHDQGPQSQSQIRSCPSRPNASTDSGGLFRKAPKEHQESKNTMKRIYQP